MCPGTPRPWVGNYPVSPGSPLPCGELHLQKGTTPGRAHTSLEEGRGWGSSLADTHPPPPITSRGTVPPPQSTRMLRATRSRNESCQPASPQGPMGTFCHL